MATKTVYVKGHVRQIKAASLARQAKEVKKYGKALSSGIQRDAKTGEIYEMVYVGRKKR